jgi:hypothetical protein
MKVTITFDVDTEDKRYSEILKLLNSLKEVNTSKEETPPEVLKYSYRIESLLSKAADNMYSWKLDDNLPDSTHWDISGNAVLVRDENGWCVVLQYRPSSGFRAFITDDNTYTPLFNLEETGKTIRIAINNLCKRFLKLKESKTED